MSRGIKRIRETFGNPVHRKNAIDISYEYPKHIRFQSLIGYRNKSIEVTSFAYTITQPSGRKVHYWNCKCDCGLTMQLRPDCIKLRSSKGCSSCIKSGENHPAYKGGVKHNNKGYNVVLVAPHTYKLEHRLVMEEIIGRYLEPNEEVHHKNGIRNDNSKDNLELWVKSQPPGQRVDDMIDFCYNFLKKYKSELLK